MNKSKVKVIYLIHDKTRDLVKIGYTSDAQNKSPFQILQKLRLRKTSELDLVETFRGTLSQFKKMKQIFARNHIGQNWFSSSIELKELRKLNDAESFNRFIKMRSGQFA